MTSDSRTAVLAAISGNAVLTVLKFGAALVGHSASMMNEAVHSLVDTLNQIFLYLGLHFGSKPPDRQYAFGHGQKKYLWNLWSAIGLFSIGCGLGLAHAWHAWMELGHKTLPGQLLLPGLGSVDVVWMSLIVLAIAFVVELVVLRLAWQAFTRQAQAEGHGRPIKYLFQSNDPTLLAVLLEDSIAVFGVLLAITGIGLTRLTGNGIWDVSFSVIIALVLGAAALILGAINMRFLTDVRDLKAEAIFIDVVLGHREIERFHDLRTMVIDNQHTVLVAEVELREEVVLAGLHQRIAAQEEDLLLQVQEARQEEPALREYIADRAAVQATLARTEEIIDDLERQIRQRCPQVSHVTIEVQGIASDDSSMTQSNNVIGGPAIEM
jgi:cation diffusion facilitator family transporter